MEIPTTRIEIQNFIAFIEGELLKEGITRQAIREAREEAKSRGLNFDKSDLIDLQEEAEAYRLWLEQRRIWLGKDMTVKAIKIAEVYTDGGVILKNPSPIGGTWAFVAVDSQGNQVHESVNRRLTKLVKRGNF